jgi:hypothetical protein
VGIRMLCLAISMVAATLYPVCLRILAMDVERGRRRSFPKPNHPALGPLDMAMAGRQPAQRGNDTVQAIWDIIKCHPSPDRWPYSLA